jgi:hypothetical protein
MDTKNPVRKEGILSRQVGEEWMLYDPENESVHVINGTAEFVWRISDGSNSTADIQKKMMETYDVSDESRVAEDVEEIINNFEKLGVITFIGS